MLTGAAGSVLCAEFVTKRSPRGSQRRRNRGSRTRLLTKKPLQMSGAGGIRTPRATCANRI